jgi:hypothetical protein
MSTPRPPTIRLGLEIRSEREPIEGVLRDELGVEQPFTGWLALMERLDALRVGASHTVTVDAPESRCNAP